MYLSSWYWDKGSFREKNEDSFSLQRVQIRYGLWGREAEAALLLVCDGIGGLPEGETASGFVAEGMTEWFYREGVFRMRGPFWRKRTAKSALEAFGRMQSCMERFEREEEICCGTTCTMALVKKNRFIIFHTGDSRAYLIGRRERLLTQDHHEGGALRRCLGAFGFEAPDIVRGRLAKGDMLLLCTDGFCRFAPQGFFQGCLRKGEQELSSCYRKLKGIGSFLKSQGEKDNLTALLLVNGGGRHI